MAAGRYRFNHDYQRNAVIRWIQCSVMMVCLLYLAAATANTDESTQPLPDAARRLLVAQLMHESGVHGLLRQLPHFIDQELENLAASSMPFAPPELAELREQLETRFAVADIRRHITERVLHAMSSQALVELREVLSQPPAERFRALQSAMADEKIQDDIRDYRLLMRDRQPRGERVALLDRLNRVLGYATMEVELKVELRKSLLASASWLKTKERIAEPLLERELASYRERVSAQTQEDARLYFLFMFKHTPSDQLDALAVLYEHPRYEQFMAECFQGLQKVFRESRAASYRSGRELTAR